MKQEPLKISFFASASFQHVAGYLKGAPKSCASQTKRRIPGTLNNKIKQLVAIPTTTEIQQSANILHQGFGIPNIPFGIDGTTGSLGNAHAASVLSRMALSHKLTGAESSSMPRMS